MDGWWECGASGDERRVMKRKKWGRGGKARTNLMKVDKGLFEPRSQ